MLLLKLLAALVTLLVQEVVQQITRLLMLCGLDEWSFQKFRAEVRKAYRGCDALNTEDLLKALRTLKPELLALEARYEELHRRIPVDLFDYEHLRYCDERELIDEVSKETSELITKMLVIAYDCNRLENPWGAYNVLVLRLDLVWERWYYRTLPVEIRRVIRNDSLHFETVEAFHAERWKSLETDCKEENR